MTVLLNPERHRAEITAALSKPLKRPVVIGQLSMSYFPPTLHLGQVAAMKDGGNPGLELESVSAPLDLPSLLKMKFIPASVLVSHWKLTLARKADGGWDLADWFAGFSGAASNPGGVIHEVRWKDGEIHAADPYAAPAQELALGSVEGQWDPKQDSMEASGAFTGPGSPARLTFKAKGPFSSAGEWSGDLQLLNGGDSCAVRIDRKASSWIMVGSSTKWPLANVLTFARFYGRLNANAAAPSEPVNLEGWQFHAARNGSQLSFQHAAGIAGGASEAKGTVDLTAAGSALRLDGAAREIPAAALWMVAGQDLPLSGKVTAVVKDFQLTLSTRAARALGGEGYLELSDGRYLAPAASLKKLSRAKTMPYIRKKFPNLESQGIPVKKLSAHWRVQGGQIAIDDGSFIAANMKAGWTANLDVARQGMDGYLRLDIREKDPKLAALIPARYRTQPIFARLQGTWQEWSLRSVTVSKMSSNIQSKLRKAASSK